MKKALLVGLLDATFKLEGQPVSRIMPEVFLEVADVVEAGDYIGIRGGQGDWKILKAKDHQKLSHTINSIRKHVEDLCSVEARASIFVAFDILMNASFFFRTFGLM